MRKAGGILDDNGKWIFNEKPVVVKILIRNDDLLRKTFGDLIASELEKIGFSVIKEYGDLIKGKPGYLRVQPCGSQLECLYRILCFKFLFTL